MPTFEMKKGAGWGKFDKRIKKIIKSLKPSQRKRANHLILAEVDKWTKENFDTEGGKVGGWAELNPAYKVYKQAIGKSKKLHITGFLRMKWRIVATPRGGSYISDMPYAKAHDEGTAKIPQRRILPTHAEMGDKVHEVYKHLVRSALHG